MVRCARGAPRTRLAAVSLALVAGQQDARPWPECQEQGVVFRHNGLHGLFVDLAGSVGAGEGCWLNDCTKSDKFVCPSPTECAIACSKVERCSFWTYEPGVAKCFLRSADGGREANPDFVSGSRSCRPAESKVAVPFAQAALWAAELPALRSCDGGIGAPGCDNPYAAMATWRYAVNNLRMAVDRLPEAEKSQNANTLQYVRQISEDVANFYRQPTAESFQVAINNLLAVFGSLRGWLASAPPSEVDLGAGEQLGAPHLPGGHSAELPAAPASAVAAARVQLADGNQMPLVGFGTWQLLGQQAYDATLAALRAGYRHIDTAQAYANEREVGLAIRDSGIPRSEIFIVTKISDPQEYAQLERRLADQLAALGTDYIDLYMLHTPGDKSGQEAAWRAMEALHTQGKVRSLGVSNFSPGQLDELLAFARVRPVYVQNKFSVYNPGEQQLAGPTSLSAYARGQGLAVMAYSTINPWPFLLPPMEDPHVRAVAGRCGRTPAQVLLRWALQLGAAVIPKSGTAQRIAENARLFDFRLPEVDMRLLNGLVTLSESNAGMRSPSWADDVYGLGSSSV